MESSRRNFQNGRNCNQRLAEREDSLVSAKGGAKVIDGRDCAPYEASTGSAAT